MADEDITLDGKPLHSLRVADLKAALEQRSLPKSGQKNTLIKRLKGALMLENLQRSSSSHSMLQPNSQIGEEMCQNSFIKQYLAKQQELLRQRLEREAQKEDDTDESPAGPEEDEDHSEDNDSFASDKHRTLPSQSSVPGVRGEPMMGRGPGSAFHHQESPEAPGVRMQRAGFQQGHREPPAPSPPRAVASLSVRVLGQPDSQGFPAAAPRPQEKEPAMHSQPGSAHPVLNLSRSARSSAGNHIQDDSDDDDDDDDDSDDDEDWGPGLGKAGERKRALPALPQMAPSISSAAAVRSKRKLQPPQHIPPPPQVDPSPMQLRHPTPPPSPPPNLFPLPDTPKQSPPDDQERDAQVVSFQLPVMQRQDSDSSSRSSSPEPPVKRRPGPLSLLVHKMETEEASSAPGLSGETAHSSAGCSSVSLLHGSETKRQESRELEDRRQMKLEKEREQQEVERERRKAQQQEKEEKRLEQEKEKERARLEEEKRQLQEEEQEKEKRRQEEEKEKKHKEEEKRKDQERLKEEKAKKDKAKQDRMVVAEAQDSGSSSDSDSKSDSSRSSHSTSSSSSSSSSSRDKVQTTNQQKKPDQEAEDEKKTSLGQGSEKQNLSKREVSEPSTAAVTEVEPDSESSMAQQPASGSEPESNESRLEESTTPKAFAARRISLTGSKASPARTDGGSGELEAGNAGGRKRRWGSSTAVTVKKPSISITTDSLKSLIPDIKVNQEAVVDLHPEELQLSGDEENLDSSRGDPDKDLRIRRTVTQVVPSDSQENGQTNEEEEEEEEEEAAEEVEKMEREKQPKEKLASRDKRKSSLSDEASETQISVSLDGEAKKVTPSDSLVRRSISQQKSGVSVTVEDPVRTNRQSSPPRGKVSNIIHVTNLVRPFTLLQLKELLNRTGSVVEEGFWIDKIKSHCFVTYATTEEAVATRTALHGVKWPSSNPKVLSVDFSEQDELDFHKGILKPKKEEDPVVQPVVPQNRLPPLMPERDREKDHNRDRDKERERDRERDRDRGVRDLWAERQREMERRERARGEREWDRDKVREFARPGEDERRSRSRDRDRERKRRERAKSKEKKSEKKEKGDEPPAKLLDDLFLKTKAAPCIYWLPLTEEQATQRVLDRIERQKERERRRKEQEEETKKREEEKKEKPKGREKDGSAPASAGAAGRGADGTRERDRGRDGDKRKESSHRSKRTSPGAGSGRRSRSRSNQRERRR